MVAHRGQLFQEAQLTILGMMGILTLAKPVLPMLVFITPTFNQELMLVAPIAFTFSPVQLVTTRKSFKIPESHISKECGFFASIKYNGR